MASIATGIQQSLAHGVQTTWAATQEVAQAGYDIARQRAEERVNIASAGKALLENGGKATEVALGAKVASGHAAAVDADLVRRLSAAVTALDDAAAKLEAASSKREEVHQGIGGVESFEGLAQAYSARAELYRQLLDSLTDLPPVPELSPVEQDAAVLLQIKDQYETVAQRTAEGCALLRSKTKEVLVSSTTSATEALRTRAVCL
jgi:hypothetical protein